MLSLQGAMHRTSKPQSQPNYKKIQNYVFDLNELLGAGNFSKVYKAVNQLTNQASAIKVVELSSIKNKTLVDLLYSEIEILKTLKHPNILNCIEVFSSNNNCYIITELCNEGDMESRIRDWGALSEMQARKFIYETFAGLKYLSDNSVIHRDLKVANIFMSGGVAKIADFGFARKLKTPDERFKDINIGSPIYMSPEGLITNMYGPKTDVWAFGIFVYEMLHGDTPLAFCQSQTELYNNLKIPITKDRMLPNLSNELKDLMIRCLEVDEKKRISFQQMYNHPYIVYLRKLYQKPEPPVSKPLVQTPKLKTSESTYGSQQSKSQAQTEALISQYNAMTPQQRAASSLSIGSLGALTGLSVTQIPQQSLTPNQNQPQSPAMKQMVGVSPQQQLMSPHQSLNPQQLHQQLQQVQQQLQQTTISQQPPSDIVQSDILNRKVSFPECVQLLHYCRLVYKCFNFGKASKSCIKINPYLSNWVLSFITEIQNKENTHVEFAGERAAVRQEKLHEVVTEYSTKYRGELKWIPGGKVSVEIIQPLILQALISLDAEIKSVRNPTDMSSLVKLAHYLYSLHESNIILKKSVDSKDFSAMTGAKIEDFLNRKSETFTLESYGGFRNKIVAN